MTQSANKTFETNVYDKVAGIKSPLWKNFFVKILQNQKFFKGTIILSLLGLPLLALAWSGDVDDYIQIRLTFTIVGIICASVALLFGFHFPSLMFKHLYKRAQVDMSLSLPLNNKQRFFSNYLAGLAMYTVPYIVSVTLALSICAIWIHEYVNVSMLAKMAFILLVVMIMFYNVLVFVLTFTGTEAVQRSLSFLTLIIVPAALGLLLIGVLGNKLYGINFESVSFPMLFSNPVGGIIYLFSYANDFYYGLLTWTIPAIICALVYFALAYFFYQRRRAEQVGESVVFMSVYYFLTFLYTICVCAIIMISEDMFLGVIISAFVAYIIIETIRNKGFKKTAASSLRFISCFIAAAIFVNVMSSTHGFGIEKYVPAPVSVSQASINYTGTFNDFIPFEYYNSDYGHNVFGNYHSGRIAYKNKDAVKIITDYHKQLIDTFNENRDGFEYSFNYTPLRYESGASAPIFEATCYNIAYKKHLGGLVLRNGYWSIAQNDLSLIPLLMTDEFADGFNGTKALAKLKRIRSLNGSPLYYQKNSFNVFSKFLGDSKNYTLNDTDFKKIFDAFSKDLKEMTVEEYETADVYAFIDTELTSRLPVRVTFKNTIETMESLGITPPDLNKDYSDLSGNSANFEVYKVNSDYNFIFKSENYFGKLRDYLNDMDSGTFSGAVSFFGKYYNVEFKNVTENYETIDVNKLRVYFASDDINPDKDYYIVNLNDRVFYYAA